MHFFHIFSWNFQIAFLIAHLVFTIILWYIIERYNWKLNEKAIPSEKKKDKLYWLKNDLYHLHFEDEEVLRCPRPGNCSPFAIAFAAESLDRKSPRESRADAERMRGHLINCLENKFLMLFLKVWSPLSVQGAAIEKYLIRQVLV